MYALHLSVATFLHLQFFDETIASPRGADLAPVIRRFVCKDLLSAIKKLDIDSDLSKSVQDRVGQLLRMLNAQMADEEIVKLRNSFPEYARALDIAGSNTTKVQALCYKILLDGQGFDVMKKFAVASSNPDEVFSPLKPVGMLAAAARALLIWLMENNSTENENRGCEYNLDLAPSSDDNKVIENIQHQKLDRGGNSSPYDSGAAAMAVVANISDRKAAFLGLRRIFNACATEGDKDPAREEAVAAVVKEICMLAPCSNVLFEVWRLYARELGTRVDVEGHFVSAVIANV